MNNVAGSENGTARFHGHVVRGSAEALTAFRQLASTSQANLFREAQHYGVTRVTLHDETWELALLPNHTFELRSPNANHWL